MTQLISGALDLVEGITDVVGETAHQINNWLNWENNNYHDNLNFGPFHHGKGYLKKFVHGISPWPQKKAFKEFLDYMHSHKQEWDFLTDNGNLLRKYLPKYGSKDNYPPGFTIQLQGNTSRSREEIEKDKNEGCNLAPYKADPATRTHTPHFYIQEKYQELPKQAYITDKPYSFWANNLRGCISVLRIIIQKY